MTPEGLGTEKCRAWKGGYARTSPSRAVHPTKVLRSRGQGSQLFAAQGEQAEDAEGGERKGGGLGDGFEHFHIDCTVPSRRSRSFWPRQVTVWPAKAANQRATCKASLTGTCNTVSNSPAR